MQQPFWKTKSLHDMTGKEWESLCCKCGICCLNRFHDAATGRVYITSIACRNLDLETCLCTVYSNRLQNDRECRKITPENIYRLKWLPKTCGYLTVVEKRSLEWWHPLISGSAKTIHQAGISIRNKQIRSEEDFNGA